MKKLLRNKGIIIFDGYCNLCSWSVQFIIKRDKKDYFRFTSLQSEIGIQIVSKYNLDVISDKSVILLENESLYLKSTAALRISKKLKALWPIIYVFIVIPAFIRDAIYDLISRNRFKWFGKRNNCYLPKDSELNKFL